MQFKILHRGRKFQLGGERDEPSVAPTALLIFLRWDPALTVGQFLPRGWRWIAMDRLNWRHGYRETEICALRVVRRFGVGL
ncbi:MAG: hypothetical protein WB621_22665 [Candidatus Acidiferrales bacterium]